jgi:hypothetical protein
VQQENAGVTGLELRDAKPQDVFALRKEHVDALAGVAVEDFPPPRSA